jgi:predicted AAA+ superfamily ATPase
VYKDIPQAFGIESPRLLERLLYALAGQITGVLSPNAICKELGLSQPTFDKYLGYLERSFLVFVLPNYSGSERSIQRRGRKLYFVDGAVRNAALQRGFAPLRSSDEMGLLMENAAASHLHALCQQDETRLFHWREGDVEVDLVYDHRDQPLAFEIASSDRHNRRGLLTFMDRQPRFRGRTYLVAPGAPFLAPTPQRPGTIDLDSLLFAAGRQAELALQRRLA